MRKVLTAAVLAVVVSVAIGKVADIVLPCSWLPWICDPCGSGGDGGGSGAC